MTRVSTNRQRALRHTFLILLMGISVEDETPDLTAGNTVSASSTSLVSNISTTPPSRFPFTNGFHDPFAPHPSFPAAGMVRETASFTPPHLPLSTSPYYSPTTEARRMSEIPLPLENYSPGSCRHLDPTGRPSASVARGTIPISRASIQSLTSANSNPTPRTSFAPPRTESPRGTPIPSHGRPRMMRYRSSPGRSTDLGLQIVVRPQPSTSGPSSGEPGFNSPSSSPASSLRRRGGRYRQRGSWTSVDVVDPLAAGADDSSSTSSRGLALLLVERRSTLAQKTEFGGRNRFESVDSALPLFGGTFLNLPQTATGWSETFPRRGSLAVLSRTPSGPWAIKGGEQGLSAGHWSERRGSWAEVWGKT